MLVIDASVAVDLCLAPNGFDELAGEDLIAPSVIHAEALSTELKPKPPSSSEAET